MNDYFQNLIDRSTNPHPAIRPQLPSFFESPGIPASSVIADPETQTIHNPSDLTAVMPDIHPRLHAFYETPHLHSTATIADLAAQINHNPQQRTESITDAPVVSAALSETERNPSRTLFGGEQSSPEVRYRETFPEILVRENASGNQNNDNKNRTNVFLQIQTTDEASNETTNLVSRETVLNNAGYSLPLPNNSPSSILDSDVNKKTDAQFATMDKNKKTAHTVLPMEPVSVLHTTANNSKRTRVFPAKGVQQPKIRPLIAKEAGPQILPSVPLQPALPEKTIKINIGRIEVRAVMPQASLSRPQRDSKETQPKISLEDYLNKQRGGSR
jgi:hypothetical protein